MDWSRTKTIFILTFLMLNVFLTYQLLEKHQTYEFNVLAETSVAERLEDNNIKIEADLPENDSEVHYVTALPTETATEGILEMYDEEQLFIEENGTVGVELDEPFELSEENYWSDVRDFVENYVYEGEQYRFGYWNSDERQHEFFQTHEGRTLYTEGESHLSLILNEDSEIVYFIQQYLSTANDEQKQEIIPALTALEYLRVDGVLSFDSTVLNVELAYFSWFQSEGEALLYSPSYVITVEGKGRYLVNAIDGAVQPLMSNE